MTHLEAVPGLGVERLLADEQYTRLLTGKRVGLIVNPTSVDRVLKHTIDLMREHEHAGGYVVTGLFAPEHGLHAALPATKALGHSQDSRTSLPVWSLYSHTREPTPQMLDEVDVLVFDLQDVGVRFYTFIWTMYRAMDAAARAQKAFIVLDRPNPLGPRLDGPILDPGLASFVGMRELPMQHGLTAGELARLFRGEFLGRGAPELHVVPMLRYDPAGYVTGYGLPWVPPSPNLPTHQAVLAHAGTGLLDGLTVSYGAGSPLPFQWMGDVQISDVEAHHLAATLNSQGLPGVIFRPMLTTLSVAGTGQPAGGVQLHIVDPAVFHPARTGLHLLRAFLDHPGVQWRRESDLHSAQYARDTYWIDRLTGDRAVRHAIDAGVEVEQIIHDWAEAHSEFVARAEPYRLY